MKFTGVLKPANPDGRAKGNAVPPACSSVTAPSSRLATWAKTAARVWNGAGGAATAVSVTIGIESWVWLLRIIR